MSLSSYIQHNVSFLVFVMVLFTVIVSTLVSLSLLFHSVHYQMTTSQDITIIREGITSIDTSIKNLELIPYAEN